MADYKVTDTELTAVANAIRAKGGTQANLKWNTDFISAINNISTGSKTLVSKTITQNGTYNPVNDNADGYSSVTVNVSGSGGGDDPFTLTSYIESSGTQYIDTGYICNINTKIEVVCDVPDDNTSHTLFGVREQNTGLTEDKGILVYYGDYGANRYKLYSQFGGNQVDNQILNRFLGKRNVFRFCKGYYNISNSIWDIVLNTFSYGTSVTNLYSLYIFALNGAGSPAALTSFKLYRFRIYEDDALVHEFIPWVDQSNVVCLKDTVTGNLKYNQGTGVFVMGTDS